MSNSNRSSARHRAQGGVIHAYQKYDPVKFPGPSQPPPDLTSAAFEHMLAFGDMRHLTEEELARAVRLDPSQIAGLGPGIDALIAMLEERKRKILAKYETGKVQKKAAKRFQNSAGNARAPKKLDKRFHQEVRDEHLRGLERLYYAVGDDQDPFAKALVQIVAALGDKYQIDELAAKYDFTGRESLTIDEALAVKEELEAIDRLLEQLREAAETAQIGVVDLEELSRFAEPGDVRDLSALQQQVQDYLREMAERQGLQSDGAGGFQLTPQAYRLFQGRLLERIFSELQAGRSGRHTGEIIGDGAVEMQQTKEYEFGDSIANLDVVGSFTNALARTGPTLPVRLKTDDLVVHRTRNNPKAATAVVMDMSGSMRYDGQYVNVKRMALALDGLIRKEFPGDYLQFIEIFSYARAVPPGDVVKLMPKPVTITNPVVRLWADMSDPDVTQAMIPPHFTNIQHGLLLARRYLAGRDAANRQIVLITDGLPTAHYEGEKLYLLYPPDPATESATMREALACAREGIVINIFLVPSWSQTEEDVRFAYRLAEQTRGRVFFTAGSDLDRFVLWDYRKRRREIIA